MRSMLLKLFSLTLAVSFIITLTACDLSPNDGPPLVTPQAAAPTATVSGQQRDDGQRVQATGTALARRDVSPTDATPNPSTEAGVPGLRDGMGRDSDVVRSVASVGPAVVTVVAKLQSRSGTFGEALGSGVIIDKAGYIVTNNHVVDGQQGIEIIYADGRKLTADQVELVGADSLSDLAVLKVSGDLPAIARLGDSDSLRPGETVVAIGSALGDFRNTVTVGVVSGLHRNVAGNDSNLEDVIQTDAAINHGNSGGPLINMDAEVIGINTAILRDSGSTGDVAEGLGFAIPSNNVRDIIGQLIKDGKVTRPFLGVRSQPITRQIASYYDLTDENGQPLSYGIYVESVTAGSPARAAGIEVGDIITRIGDQQLNADNTISQLLSRLEPGQTVTVHLLRGGRTLDLQVTLVERPAGP